MARNTRRLACGPEAVFEVLADGWLYPSWVVGASRMRAVDDPWPAAGACLHHSVGSWPLLLNDTTVCREWDPPRRMVLEARGWPLGTAQVVIEARSEGEGCLVRIVEYAARGPATLVPRPIADPVIAWRNRETLRRLAFLAEGRAEDAPPAAAREHGVSS